jgi:signal transduction histidine kinase
MATDSLHDIEAVGRIPAVPTILEVVCRTTGMGFAAVARVTEDRWIACSVKDNIAFGLAPGGELKIETTICSEIREHHRPVVINHVAEDPLFRHHRTPALYGFQSYISVPIKLPDGSFFGTLCAIDPRPARIDTPEILGMFTLFAELIAFHLAAHRRLDADAATILEAHETGELREQFIAVLGHDLRNPLASIDAGTQLLLRTPLNEKAIGIVRLMQNGVRRMSGLIENMLDLTRTRLGSGLTLDTAGAVALAPFLRQVFDELRVAQPDRPMEAEFLITRTFPCDHQRIGQLLSNLLGNALTHGAPGQTILVYAATTEHCFTLSVSNGGTPIPPIIMARLFQPFFRGDVQENQEGLGLGLYIASEVARAHGGELSVTSTGEETRFTFTMPILP